ncbi:hypothetical protein [Mycolicibacterium komossense]|uniref:Uncharacterized protein n=1 Tax=Mycolicibacterium komossense TaxID=1779 RepID=A0ABT3C890_9MYCO|nr:hypothetical protein [Mycolicibacterium komossense]MCV7225685.1 hypothetical protein [Mycolicibacterium komossense]
MTGDAAEPERTVDAFVAEIAPGVLAPGVRRRDAVLVMGPWLAGTSSVLAALRNRLPQNTFIESTGLCDGDAPMAVVFVVSAVAPLTESDCALLDAAAVHTDLVVCAVAKIDLHRRWREVLDADRQLLAAHAPRYGAVTWEGVAAAPDLGDIRLNGLVEALGTQLADSQLRGRNRLRSWESQLAMAAWRYDGAADSSARAARVAALGASRVEVGRQRRMARTERAVALRSRLQQARVQLSHFARNRCTSVRSELQEDVASMTRRSMATFPADVRRRVAGVAREVDESIGEHLAEVADVLGLQTDSSFSESVSAEPVGEPPLTSRRVETRLMMLLGAGFGLGVALTLSRIFAELAPELTVAGAVLCILVGLAVTVWVVGMRGLLHDRAVLDRWVCDVTAALRADVEQSAATRVLAAETALTVSLAEHDETRSAVLAAELRTIDAELRQHALARARAVTARDEHLPIVQRALDAVRAELAQRGYARITHEEEGR